MWLMEDWLFNFYGTQYKRSHLFKIHFLHMHLISCKQEDPRTNSVDIVAYFMLCNIILGYIRSLIRAHLKWIPVLPIWIEHPLNFVFQNGKVRLMFESTFLGSWEDCFLLTWGLGHWWQIFKKKYETKYPRKL